MSLITPIIGRRGALAGTATLLTAPAWAQAPNPGSAPTAAITVDRARTDPIPIAIPTMGGDLGAQITGVISADLQRSGLFKPVSGGAAAGDAPNFNAWKATGAQALVTGTATSGRVEFRLWDVPVGQQIQGTAYTTAAGNWRRVAHIIADVIYERLLGEKGYFDTRIVYVAGSGPRDRRVKRLAIMDQDSENNRYLTDGSWLVLTPRFHPTRDEIVFMSYANNRPRVYSFNLGSGAQRVLGEFDGITFAPRFAPDGSHVIMSVTRGAGSDIVTVGLGGGGSQRLTNSGAIDTSPCYSPDGSQIVFNSDRGGDQQLYVMSSGGGGAKRISFGSGRYATPVWSPRGDLIAFTRLGSSFAIGVMHPDGSGERILSESFDVEGPTFCPNGRVLMFFRESAARDNRGGGYGSKLVSIDITGFNERAVPTAGDASDPAWSPLLA
ncbi:Tol-Pal system beta propeller repeat protein TolB [Acidisphaera sp. L21]|uniref:Tol-Pal system beta propeller repeat protein TolB n=1 Tax=Acidisphaera sp. L21 TaxID=1641851 RepID=UPI00131DC44E|nr:Tol-Pal system beta propeller repeat protein TolB [Acidisphaera sp. L21]